MQISIGRLANLLNARGNFPGAQFHFKAALRSAPSLAEVHLAYAIALAAHGQPAPAEHELQAALQLAPDHYEAHLRLGQLLQTRGEAERAKQHLRKAAESPASGIRQAAQDSLRNQ